MSTGAPQVCELLVSCLGASRIDEACEPFHGKLPESRCVEDTALGPHIARYIFAEAVPAVQRFVASAERLALAAPTAHVVSSVKAAKQARARAVCCVDPLAGGEHRCCACTCTVCSGLGAQQRCTESICQSDSAGAVPLLDSCAALLCNTIFWAPTAEALLKCASGCQLRCRAHCMFL